MKSCNEMVNSLLERRQQYETEKKRRRKQAVCIITPLCCVCVVVLLGFGVWRMGMFENLPINAEEDIYKYENEETYEDFEKDIAEVESESYITAVLEEGDVWIYYVGEKGIARKREHLPLSPKDVFKSWKEKNGIGEDVKFIGVNIEDNSKTEKVEENGMTLYRHTMGDYFIYNLTISKEIENYYGKTDSALLLESLKQTMTEWSTTKYNEYNLILE